MQILKEIVDLKINDIHRLIASSRDYFSQFES